MTRKTVRAVCVLAAFAGPAFAAPAFAAPAFAAEFQAQHLTEKPTIDVGANIILNDQQSGGASSIDVYSAKDLAFKGHFSVGASAHVLLSPDGKTAYTVSVYMKRYTYGDAEMVMQIFDVPSLSPIKEIPLPPKLVMGTAYQGILAQSVDGKFVFVQNATPATSVTVVDVVAGKVAGEIPTPGCFGIYPSAQAMKFSMI